MYLHPQNRTPQRRRGVVLLAVLVVVVVLTLAAYQFSEMMSSEYRAADSFRRAAQARALADSGLHYAAALLSSPDAFTNTLNSNPFDNPGVFQAVLVMDGASDRSRGRFSIIAPLDPDTAASVAQAIRYGVIDETGKLNINALMKLDSSGKVAHDILMLLPNATEDVVNSILDWIDADEDTRSNGAESDYYSTLSPGYQCKNGPLDSLEELLFVKGVTAQLLFGNDLNRNGILDPDEDDGSGTLDQGWSAFLTIYSRELNIDADGNPRIYINDNDLSSLQTQLSTALGDELASFIIAYRQYGPASGQGQSGAGGAGGAAGVGGAAMPAGGAGAARGNTPAGTGARPANAGTTRPGGGGASPSTTPATGRSPGGSDDRMASSRGRAPTRLNRGSLNLSQGGQRRVGSLFELIGAQVSIPGQNGQSTTYDSPLNDAGQLRQLLPLLLDKTTTETDGEIPARVNVNTAPRAVLATLPGLEDGDVQTILDHRPTPSTTDAPDPIFQTPAWLITEASFPSSKLQALEKYITTRSQVYRVQSVGYFDGGGPTVRLEAIIDTNAGRPRLIAWRDLTELGKGYDMTAPPASQ
jgi:type II secretory pathway component PulK